MNHILQVAVPTPLWRRFHYLTPPHCVPCQLQPGVRLRVPFGSREVVGVLLDVVTESPLPDSQLKAAQEILDQQPFIPTTLLFLYRWASDYYHYPIGEVVVGTLPRLLRQGKEMDVSPQLDALHTAQSPVDLNAEQLVAVDSINAQQGFQTFLLSGVTGSGKTEVYLQCIDHVLKKRRQVLVLVPEIGLTPQTVERFRQRFVANIAVFHSNLTDKARAQAWMTAKNGLADIVIGTRSAIFTPLCRPGMIILDEEHDSSFKQQSGFRYSARDVGVMRGHIENVPVVLGTATPSLESLYNVTCGKYQRLNLPARAGGASLPSITILDMRQKKLLAGMSEALLIAIEKHLDNRGQVMLFLNRRGFASTLLCHACGWIVHCDRCDARLTLHHSPKRLFCHHCGASKAVMRVCPDCRQSELIDVGLGTERVESVLQQRYPQANIVRIDRDSTRRKNSMLDKLQQVHNREADILIGTQMIAKGHHFSHLSLVAIVDADSGLFSTDFRATEHMGQLLLQVAGRSGRELQQGEVLVQTHQPEHPLLKCLLEDGYDAFAQALLAEREAAQLPPFSHMALLRMEAKNADLPPQLLQQAKQFISQSTVKNLQLLGPIPAAMERKAGRYRYQLLLQSSSRASLHQALAPLTEFLLQQKQIRQVRWSLDVDPLETI